MPSASARSGAMPTPAPMKATLSRVRARGESLPYGPSTSTVVPGLIDEVRALLSPSAFTEIRSERPSGAADREYGLPRVQPSRSMKRQTKNWPDSTFIADIRWPVR